jgi:hypothetical protein
VQINANNAVGASAGKQASDISGGDGGAVMREAVLAAIAEVRHDGGEALAAGTTEGGEGEVKFHKGVVHRRAHRLNQVHIARLHGPVHFHQRC